tara:strand:+ start:367 stop:477 length:111 start_codon:yes stop_codon:yes gene_type:complete
MDRMKDSGSFDAGSTPAGCTKFGSECDPGGHHSLQS